MMEERHPARRETGKLLAKLSTMFAGPTVAAPLGRVTCASAVSIRVFLDKDSPNQISSFRIQIVRQRWPWLAGVGQHGRDEFGHMAVGKPVIDVLAATAPNHDVLRPQHP